MDDLLRERVLHESSKALDLMQKNELTPAEQDAVIADGVENFTRYVNPGILELVSRRQRVGPRGPMQHDQRPHMSASHVQPVFFLHMTPPTLCRPKETLSPRSPAPEP